jgi:hypothetical protein
MMQVARFRGRAWGPLLWSLLMAAFLHTLHVLHIYHYIASPVWISLCFVPLLAFDAAYTVAFQRDAHGSDVSVKRLMGIIFGNSVVWIIAFSCWVLVIGRWAQAGPYFQWTTAHFHYNLWLILISYDTFSAIVVALWLGTYFFVTGRSRRLRLMTTACLPIFLLGSMAYSLLVWGGIGYAGIEHVESQPGVSRVLDPRRIQIEGAPEINNPMNPTPLRCVADGMRHMEELKRPFSWHPRSICVDDQGKVLIMGYGRSWLAEEAKFPIVLRYDTDTHGLACFQDWTQHKFACRPDGKTLWIAPWRIPGRVLGLDAEKLSITTELKAPSREVLESFKVVPMLEDPRRDRLYVGTELESTVIAYDLKGQEIAALLKLASTGRVGQVGGITALAQSQRTGRLYAISGHGDNLFEFDPDTLEILRSMDLERVIGTSMALDEEAHEIYYQCSLSNALYRISLDTFEVVRTYEGAAHSWSILLDSAKRALYELDWLGGKLFALDTESGERLWEIDTGGRPSSMTRHHDTLWINSMLGVIRVDLAKVWDEKRPGKLAQ